MMHKKHCIKASLGVWKPIFCLLLCLFSVSCSRPQDYILVVDTSGSMSFGNRYIEKIKANIETFMDNLESGDSISLLGFDSNSRFYRTYRIRNEADRQRVVQKVRSFVARGAYTDMDSMLDFVFSFSKKLKKTSRQLVLIIMSDGKDDPPPWKKRRTLRLEALSKGNWFSNPFDEPYIYYVSLGKLHDTKLRKNLTRLSPRVRNIKDSQTAGLEEVIQDIDTQLLLSILFIFLCSLVSLALLACGVYWFCTRHKLSGILEYYDIDVGPDFRERFRLSKLSKHRLVFGRKAGAQLKIRDFAHSQNLNLRATSFKGSPCLRISKKELEHFNFKRKRFEARLLVAPGDHFEAGNYIFEYK